MLETIHHCDTEIRVEYQYRDLNPRASESQTDSVGGCDHALAAGPPGGDSEPGRVVSGPGAVEDGAYHWQATMTRRAAATEIMIRVVSHRGGLGRGLDPRNSSCSSSLTANQAQTELVTFRIRVFRIRVSH